MFDANGLLNFSYVISGKGQTLGLMDEQDLMLHLAVEAEDIVRVRSLLEQGIDVDERDAWNATPLHLAATHEVPDIARLLLDYGADIGARHKDGMTPLDMAAWYGREEIVRLLLKKRATQNQTDLQRAVRVATMDNGYKVIPILQEFGAKLGLIEAMYLGDTEAVSRFLGEGVDIDQMDDGSTLLMHAVTAALDHPYHNYIPLISERGADVNARSADGFTPLMTAAKWGNMQLVHQLLEYGADPGIQGPSGQTALSLASIDPEHHADVIEAIRQASAKKELGKS